VVILTPFSLRDVGALVEANRDGEWPSGSTSRRVLPPRETHAGRSRGGSEIGGHAGWLRSRFAHLGPAI
jgi:hypothetical protein